MGMGEIVIAIATLAIPTMVKETIDGKNVARADHIVGHVTLAVTEVIAAVLAPTMKRANDDALVRVSLAVVRITCKVNALWVEDSGLIPPHGSAPLPILPIVLRTLRHKLVILRCLLPLKSF